MPDLKPDLHDGLPPLLNLDNLANGAIYEMMGEALENIAKNINDPNTDAKAKRSVTIKIDISPNLDRSGFGYQASVSSKLAGMKPAEGVAYIAKRNGQFLVVGKNHKQMEIELAAAEPDGTTPQHKN